MNRHLGLCFLTATALMLGACSSAPRPGVVTPDPGYDLIIENGRVVDGTGAAWFYGDVAIRGDRIARIAPRGLLRGVASRERIDANGLVVAPGFWDIQSHSRGAFLGRGDGRVVSKVTKIGRASWRGRGWRLSGGGAE